MWPQSFNLFRFICSVLTGITTVAYCAACYGTGGVGLKPDDRILVGKVGQYSEGDFPAH